MDLLDLRDRRILVTQADAFMGPALCRVLSALGAVVLPDTNPLADDPRLPGSIVDAAGHVDVLIAHLAVPAPSTPVGDVDDDEWRHVFAHLVDPLPRLVRAVLPQMRNPSNFDKVKVGDKVEITYTEAFAIDVQPKGSAGRLRGMRQQSGPSS
jgi:hypothetical protein